MANNKDNLKLWEQVQDTPKELDDKYFKIAKERIENTGETK